MKPKVVAAALEATLKATSRLRVRFFWSDQNSVFGNNCSFKNLKYAS